MDPQSATDTPKTANHPDPEFAIETLGLSKTYRPEKNEAPVQALNNVSLKIPRGSFFGLLGPNGAGKSTFINILAGLVKKTSGEARIWDYDIEKDMRNARLAIGIVPQELNIDPYFTPRELLDVQAGLYGVPKAERRTEEVLDAIGLADKANAYTRALSGGMRRRLLVGKAMVHSPPVLVLDEPSAGVDVDMRRQLWQRVSDMNRSGTTVLLTTHYLEEAQALCDTIAIIDHGNLIACQSTKDLLARLDSKEMIIRVDQDVAQIPDTLDGLKIEIRNARELIVLYPPSKIHSGDILHRVQAAGLGVLDISTKEAELEDIFLNLTGKPRQ
ncbi:MAG: ABC transporter ATP-binding protein [Rhodospirillales bacterium]